MSGNRRRFISSLFLVITFVTLLMNANVVLSAVGNWYSAYATDLNGYSTIGTTNGQQLAVYDFILQNPSGGQLGYAERYLEHGQSTSASFWSTPLTTKRGVVITSHSGVVHAPWFDA